MRGVAASLADSAEGRQVLGVLGVQDEPGAVLDAIVEMRAAQLSLKSVEWAQACDAAACGPPPVSAGGLLPTDIQALREALDMPDATDQDIRTMVLRLNLAGLRVIPTDELTAMAAWLLRRATRTFAEAMSDIATRYARTDDVELVEQVHPRPTDELLSRWLEDG